MLWIWHKPSNFYGLVLQPVAYLLQTFNLLRIYHTACSQRIANAITTNTQPQKLTPSCTASLWEIEITKYMWEALPLSVAICLFLRPCILFVVQKLTSARLKRFYLTRQPPNQSSRMHNVMRPCYGLMPRVSI